MNVFNLFENKNISDIKLGLKVVKSLCLENEFEIYFKRNFKDYEVIFNNIVLNIVNDNDLKQQLNRILYDILDENFNLCLLSDYHIRNILEKQPQLINYFDVMKFSNYHIRILLYAQPQLINNVDVSSFGSFDICCVLLKQPQLIDYFDLDKLNKNEIVAILIRQPQLNPYFNESI